ncbi:proteoglycan 4b isoform X2 [Betta splendens]|uniref:Proteoglycan 4b isoform X2 n=1 Tax=Betta splendens TaxID=158456 RepID=A0A6P7M8U4_BETSP|nr:proteoglycan 4b isoform X2 [Betta splendens]
MRMSSTVFYAVTVLASVLTFTAAQTSCKGRCGTEYYRGFMCQCDYGCLSYGECCHDYESKCTTRNSCKGRCGEIFKRGRRCSCDSDCLKYNQCCSDYKSHCDAEEPALNKGIDQPFSEDDPMVSASYPPDDPIKDQGDPILPSGYGFTADPSEEAGPTVAVTTETVTLLSPTETATQADDGTSTLYMSSGEGATESTADSTATTAPRASMQPSVASSSATKSDSSGQAPEGDTIPETNPTEASSPEPEVTTTSFSAASYSSVEPTQDPSVPQSTQASPAAHLTPSPDPTTSQPEPGDAETPSVATTRSDPAGPGTSTEPDTSTTQAPSTFAPVEPDSQSITPETPPTDPVEVTSTASKPDPTETSSVPGEPSTYEPAPIEPAEVKATTKPGTKPLDDAQTTNSQDPADDRNDTDLCSGRPVGAVTTLRNGTTVVFRGHYFWLLDSNRNPGPARGITEVWGVPSPVDTVFTRCNCQGKTYIFKGPQYWRFENGVLDPGFPRVIETGFDGLRGHITAALSVPQHRSRRESVYFFKRGGTVQRYSYQFGTRPTCGKKVQYAIYTVRNRVARQAVSVLEAPINIQKTWRGFPSTITAAVSVPNNREPDGYKYYVFSRSKSYSVKMDGQHPAIAASNANTSPQSKEFFTCPKKA